MSDDPCNSKSSRIVELIDGYLWVTRGSNFEDEYSIQDEDDFEDFYLN